MKTVFAVLTLALTASAGFAGPQSRTFTGVVSDSMCQRDHAMMKVSPDSTCVTACIKASKDIDYTLLVGKSAYTLSDRQKPARFAGQKVRVTGVLNTKTKVIQVDSIEAVR